VKEEGEQKGSARWSVHWGCYDATALDIEVDPQRCCLGSCQSDFALQAVVDCTVCVIVFVQFSSVGAGMVWGGEFFSSFWDRVWAE
jgi:hypothetical protein